MKKQPMKTNTRKKLYDPASGKAFGLSRSKLDLFIECPRCFYLDRKLGIGRPPGLPFTLNQAVDTLLKKEFNACRHSKKPHPLMNQYGIDAVPFDHPDLGIWRLNNKGASCLHAPTGMNITGAIDDVWVKPDGSLIIADYKATSTFKEITMESGYKAVFKRQLEIYQWIFRHMGFTVDKMACLVYANALKTPAGLSAGLPFEMSILKIEADDSWVEDAIIKAHACLQADEIPAPAPECDHCNYVKQVREVLP